MIEACLTVSLPVSLLPHTSVLTLAIYSERKWALVNRFWAFQQKPARTNSPLRSQRASSTSTAASSVLRAHSSPLSSQKTSATCLAAWLLDLSSCSSWFSCPSSAPPGAVLCATTSAVVSWRPFLSGSGSSGRTTHGSETSTWVKAFALQWQRSITWKDPATHQVMLHFLASAAADPLTAHFFFCHLFAGSKRWLGHGAARPNRGGLF